MRYCRAPVRLLYSEGSAIGAPSVADNLDLISTGVVVEWHSLIPALEHTTAEKEIIPMKNKSLKFSRHDPESRDQS